MTAEIIPLSARFSEALRGAAEATQFRKGTAIPYIAHLYTVRGSAA